MAKTLNQNSSGKTARITIALSEETAKAVRSLAYLENVSVSELCERELSKLVRQHEGVLQKFSVAEDAARNEIQK